MVGGGGQEEDCGVGRWGDVLSLVRDDEEEGGHLDSDPVSHHRLNGERRYP